MVEGYIYLLFNPSFRQDRYKIGVTTRLPSERAKELSSATGVPEPFEVLHERKVFDCHKAERIIKNKLEQLRISSNREFYQIKLQDAINIINNTTDEIENTASIDQFDIEESSVEEKLKAIKTVDSFQSNIFESEIDINPPKKRSVKSTSLKKPSKKTIEDHLTRCNENTKRIFEQFRIKIKQLDPIIQEKVTSYGLAYEVKNNFVEMYFNSNWLWVCLLPGKYHDPEGLLGHVPESYKKTWKLIRRFRLEDERQIPYLIDLVQQSLDISLEH